MVQLEQHIVFVGPAASAFLNFLVHAARHEVTGRQVLQCWRVALHEAFAFAVQKDGTLTAASLGQQHARASHAGGVKLPKLHVLKWQASARCHTEAITGVDEGVGRRRKDPAGAACREQRSFGFEDVDIASFHFHGGDANDVTIRVANEIQRHPLNKKCGARFDVLLVQGVQHRVPRPVSGRAGTLDGLLTVIRRVAAKWALVDGAVWVAVEGHAHVFQVIHHFWRFAAHELNRVLVAQPVRALDGVVEVVVPIVLGHVAQRGADTALCGNSV